MILVEGLLSAARLAELDQLLVAMSFLPGQNTGPAAVSTTARTASSAAMSARRSANADSIARERLLRAAGRFSVRMATAPSSSRRTNG